MHTMAASIFSITSINSEANEGSNYSKVLCNAPYDFVKVSPHVYVCHLKYEELCGREPPHWLDITTQHDPNPSAQGPEHHQWRFSLYGGWALWCWLFIFSVICHYISGFLPIVSPTSKTSKTPEMTVAIPAILMLPSLKLDNKREAPVFLRWCRPCPGTRSWTCRCPHHPRWQSTPHWGRSSAGTSWGEMVVS